MAAVLERSFIEICGFERETAQRFREVTVNLGLSALPGGVKFPDGAGAFHYEESGKLLSVTSNRFIHWSTSGDTVQLVEQSLDTNLLNNAVKLKFSHCTVLPGGVHIQETLNNVIILISTNLSVHRLLLPHPTRMYRSELVTELHMQSIFTDVGKLSLQEPSHSAVIPSSVGQTGSPSTSTAWLSQSGEAHYALASPAGGIMVVTLPPHNTQALHEDLCLSGGVSVLELKRNSMMQRLSGWMPTAIRGDQSPSDLVLSLAVRELEEDSFIFALCQDHKLRMWSFREQTCLLEADMLEYMPACKGVKRLAGQGHRLRLAFSSTTGLCLAVYLAVPQRGQFTVLQLVVTDNNRYSLDHISSQFSTQETYLEVLFSPLRFTASAIVKALQIYRRGSERITNWSWEALKKEVTVAVESELQSSVTEFEFSQEEYRQLQVEFWSKFYACCLQYQEAQSMPLGLTVSQHTSMVCLLKKGFVSFLLPCFAVDHLYLSYDEYLSSEEDTPITEDPEVGRDVLQLVQCLRMVSDAVSGEMAYEMEKALEHLQSPERAAELVLENMLSNDKDANLQHLTVLELSDSPALSTNRSVLSPQTVVELFYQTAARKTIISHIYAQQQSNSLLHWSHMTSNVVHLLAQMLYPSMTQQHAGPDVLIIDVCSMVIDVCSMVIDVCSVIIDVCSIIIDVCSMVIDVCSMVIDVCSIIIDVCSMVIDVCSIIIDVCSMVIDVCSIIIDVCSIIIDVCSIIIDVCSIIIDVCSMVIDVCSMVIDVCSIVIDVCSVIIDVCSIIIDVCSVVIDVCSVIIDVCSIVIDVCSIVIDVCSMIIDVCSMVIDVCSMVIDVCSVIIDVCSIVIDVCSMVIDVCSMVIDVCSMVIDVCSMVIDVCSVIIDVCSIIIDVCSMVIDVCSMVIDVCLMVIDVCSVIIAVCSMVIDVCSVIIDVCSMVIDVCSMIIDVCSMVIEVCSVVIEVCSMVIEVCSVIIEVCSVIIEVCSIVIDVCSIVIDVCSIVIDEYVRLIGPWCQVNIGSCRFMLGQCYLANGEGQKALQCFQEAATEVEKEEFLMRLTGTDEDEAASTPRLQYYNKVLRLLEDVGLPEFVIQLASLAITEAASDVNSQLVVVLCERSQLQDLVQFSYVNLHDEVVSIIESRARGLDLLAHNYYELLYAFHINRHNYRKVRRQVDILELKDLEKEYILSRSRLTLAQHHPPSAAIAGSASSSEIVSLLVQSGLFDSALSVSLTFRLNLSPVFEGLTFKCIKLQFGGEESQNEAWSWLAANQLSSVVNTKESSATDEAWRLLASYLDRYPSANGQYHRCVINKLLSHGVPLPDWLVKSYKAVDAASLLRLFLNFDLLDDAAELVTEYVDALLGKGHLYYGIQRPLSATSPSVWLPYTSIDQLLQTLNETQTNSSVYNRVRDKLDDYHRLVEQTTKRRLVTR
ncbi:Nuclear pore complex protein [Collichthys lucidus]|uniref:Nuclear pore complex protein n=1 Tax=Collichthys lucidus TaxID=240159 RepID=A0A4U5UE64_COLLU|nr:Nuclear pore complex protein [Collichthys lucidus]